MPRSVTLCLEQHDKTASKFELCLRLPELKAMGFDTIAMEGLSSEMDLLSYIELIKSEILSTIDLLETVGRTTKKEEFINSIIADCHFFDEPIKPEKNSLKKIQSKLFHALSPYFRHHQDVDSLLQIWGYLCDSLIDQSTLHLLEKATTLGFQIIGIDNAEAMRTLRELEVSTNKISMEIIDALTPQREASFCQALQTIANQTGRGSILVTLGFSHHSITSHPALENITTECIYLDQDHSFTELKNKLAPHRDDITCFNVDITPNNWVKKFKELHHCCDFTVKHYTQPSPVFFQKSAAVSTQLLSTSKPVKQPTGHRTLHERAEHS